MADKEASSAVADGHSETPVEKKDRRASSGSGATTLETVEAEGKEPKVVKEHAKLNWKINTSPTADSLGVSKDLLAKQLITPPLKKVEMVIPPGVHITARNLKGVTIKDMLDAIHKQYKKRKDDELDLPVLSHIYYDPTEKGVFGVVLVKEGQTSSKKKGKGGE